MFELSATWCLVLLLLLPWAAWRLFSRRRRSAVVLSTASRGGQIEPTWRQRTLWVMPVLELAALALVVIAIARPREGTMLRPREAEGIAIELAIDRSGSMERDDFQIDGAWVTRLEAVQRVAGEFLSGSPQLSGRPNDLVGVVAFARQADEVSALTLDHDFAVARLEQIRFASDFREDGTAIGDALGLAVAHLHEYGRQRAADDDAPPLSKVVVLLTDGEQNSGELTPADAATLAKSVGVKVHVIAIRPARADDAESTRTEKSLADLRVVAETTGGELFLASDTAALSDVYARIDALETTEIEDLQYVDHREWAIEPFRVGPFGFPPLVLLGVLLLSSKLLLSRLIYRTIP